LWICYAKHFLVDCTTITNITNKPKLEMPKMKVKGSAKKRFKITASGKIKRKHAYKAHKLGHKSKKQKRVLSGFTVIHKADETNVKLALAMK